MNLYIHIPFCASRCTYCDFNTYAGLDDSIPGYMFALRTEIGTIGEMWRDENGEELQIETIFVGGGTPSLLPLSEIEKLREAITAAYAIEPELEWSMEANPGTLSHDYLAGLFALGVNRLSLGVQSSHASELALLGRIHTFAEAEEAYHAARQTGFTNLNLDLIYNLPGQSMSGWQDTLQRCLALQPDHLSLYALSVEEETPLWDRVSAGELPIPNDDLAADMYAWAEDFLAHGGYAHYEISNWARLRPDEPPDVTVPQNACRHNLHIWRNQAYLGFGAGAHGFADGIRYANIRHPHAYADAAKRAPYHTPFPLSPAMQESHKLTPAYSMTETMILGLRLLLEGVSRRSFFQTYGIALDDVFGKIVEEYTGLGLLVSNLESVRLSQRGHLLANQVMQAFLP
ncbi:MAG: radical SAM family heme chaperone HemW [Anaerolineales bacterium]|nr:radical SAM family heme chaperone HemW [Anaerolineales bacterium]